VNGLNPQGPNGTLDAYFNAFCTDVNVDSSLEPRPATAAMMAIEMPAAIRPYSIAVAPAYREENGK
jgi:hypothetical protein